MKKLHLLMLCLAALAFCRCDDKRVTVGDLTVEMLENPVGLDERTPRFGWQLRSDLRDVAQTSYRIVVAGSENDLKKNLYYMNQTRNQRIILSVKTSTSDKQKYPPAVT